MICPFIVFWDAEFVTSIEIRVAEAAREAVEATWRLEFGLKCYLRLQKAVN